MEKDVLRHADPARGRFRAFLLTALKHYVANEHVRATADKRGGAEAALPIDLETAEGRYGDQLQNDRTPERLYDRQWALAVLEGALVALRIECQANGRGALLDAARAMLTGDHDRVGYKDIARRFGMSESGARVAVHRLRVRYRDLVRAAIAQTVDSDKAVDDELRYLRAALDG
jgi:RNA polymerase sigma-70 factor (ECF subfamily)